MGQFKLTDHDILRRIRDDGEFYAWLDIKVDEIDRDNKLYAEQVLAARAAHMMERASSVLAAEAQAKGITLND